MRRSGRQTSLAIQDASRELSTNRDNWSSGIRNGQADKDTSRKCRSRASSRARVTCRQSLTPFAPPNQTASAEPDLLGTREQKGIRRSLPPRQSDLRLAIKEFLDGDTCALLCDFAAKQKGSKVSVVGNKAPGAVTTYVDTDVRDTTYIPVDGVEDVVNEVVFNAIRDKIEPHYKTTIEWWEQCLKSNSRPRCNKKTTTAGGRGSQRRTVYRHPRGLRPDC